MALDHSNPKYWYWYGENMMHRNGKSGSEAKISTTTVIVCVFSVLFAAISIFISNNMWKTTVQMYEHPYAVTNISRGMQSRLLDMKRFVGIFLTYDFETEEKARELFQERYDMQNEAIDAIYDRYLGPVTNVDALRLAMDMLIACQAKAIQFADRHPKDAIKVYLEEKIYPRYDAVNESLDTIIQCSDERIHGLTKTSKHTAWLSIGIALSLSAIIILLSIYSNRIERKSIEKLTQRERELRSALLQAQKADELRDALLLAQKASKAKKEFLSRMSHEIRTPMNVIIGMTTIASTHLDERPRLEDCLSKIANSSRHLLSIINDVLDMSKIEEGKLSISHDPFQLRNLIESVISIVYPQAAGQDKNFDCGIHGLETEMLVGDSLRTKQILLNLLSNAIKFTPQGGSVRLDVRQARMENGKTRLQFSVSDTGIGMNEEFLGRLFQPFEQADNSISVKYGGTGLGMAITQNLVELLGGSIRVESKPEEGTTFTVALPFDVPDSPVDRRQVKLEHLKVLVADDDRDTCVHTALLLERMGINARWVQSGSEAVRTVLEAHGLRQGFDVCFLDWKMPDMDGVEVTRRIRERIGPETLIIIISAYDWSAIEEEAREAGANAFVAKPLFDSSLHDVLLSTMHSASFDAGKPRVRPGICRGKHFLLAEDNALNREIAVELLKETQAEIDCVENGEQAVARFLASSEGYYSLILMDIQMPVMDGYEAAKVLRANNVRADAATVPIVAMTADAFKEDVEQAFAAGMNGHIAKPIEIESLYRVLADIFISGNGETA